MAGELAPRTTLLSCRATSWDSEEKSEGGSRPPLLICPDLWEVTVKSAPQADWIPHLAVFPNVWPEASLPFSFEQVKV